MEHIKKQLEYIIKHNVYVQAIYKTVLSAFFKFIGLFIRQDENLILFSSFGGKKYNDSPRILFEAMQNDSRFSGSKFVWAFEKPTAFTVSGARKVKIDSLSYFIVALKAKVWITSVNIERGLHFKKPGTVYINTWHGAGTKKIGNACSGRRDYDFSGVNIMLVQSQFEKEIFVRDFRCSPSAIRMVGFPRNDELFHKDKIDQTKIRRELNIPQGKKVILYAPTWRDSKTAGITYEFTAPITHEKWKEKLGSEYVMLMRMHTFTTNFSYPYDDFARDVSAYENLNHLLAIADVVITDYSTIVYDCAIAEKPFICFGFDYDSYKEERGFYYDLDTVYPGGVIHDEDSVIDRIRKVVAGEDAEKYKAFRDKYIEAGGHSTQTVLNELSVLLAKAE